MIKGKWVIIAVLAVAVFMGMATWPLMRIRRNNEIHKTEVLLESVLGSCEHYRTRHGRYPESLGALAPVAPLGFRDAWRRPLQYEVDAGSGKLRLWSRGPDPDDSSDDISRRR